MWIAPTRRESLLLTKPTNVARHTGGVRIKPGSPEEQILAKWVGSLASASDATLAAAMKLLHEREGEAAPKQLVRRLTHAQYNNTVRDLLGDYSHPAQRFPPEDYVDGFKNQLTAQDMPPLLVETYSTAAERLAMNAFRVGDINGLIPCKPSSASDAKCRDAFVRKFGLRAFRRPLREDEVKRYTAVFSEQARIARRFIEGARVVVEAMLQSPNFLFHVEAGPDGKSVDYDIASRLSYLLWNTMPDAALFAAAEKGELRTAEGRERAAAPHARRRPARPAGARPVFRGVAALRSRDQRGQSAQSVPGVHAGAGRGDGRGDAHAPPSPRLERPELHGSADGRLQLPHLRSGVAVRRAAARRSSSRW